MWFILLFISIFATGILELRWSGVGIEDWWRNEQFWVIGGTSAHIFVVFQGLLKVLSGIDTNFTKASDEDGDFAELYVFKWTTLLVPPTTVLIANMVGIVAGVSYAVNSGYQSWGPLFGKLFFAIWVIVHLYPFLKGLLSLPGPSFSRPSSPCYGCGSIPSLLLPRRLLLLGSVASTAHSISVKALRVVYNIEAGEAHFAMFQKETKQLEG